MLRTPWPATLSRSQPRPTVNPQLRRGGEGLDVRSVEQARVALHLRPVDPEGTLGHGDSNGRSRGYALKQAAGQQQGNEHLRRGLIHSHSVYHVHRLVQKSITLIAAVFLLFAAYTSIRIAYAEFLFRQNTLDSVQQATRLDPADARYFAWLAELLENNGQDPGPALDTAIRLNPLDSRLWIRRALNVEAAGNPAEAERLLLHAASIDRLMEPRWTLMNFYFRRGDAARFWPWAQQTFAISYGDRAPLFDLCWRLKPDPASIARVLPTSYPVEFQFFQFLIEKDRLADAAALAKRILPLADPADTKSYLRCADRLLRSGDAAGAARLWNALCDRRLLPFAAAKLSRTQPSSTRLRGWLSIGG